MSEEKLKKVKENSRDRLVAASLQLFSLKGFHGVSIREICEAAKANISLISFHFGGKEGLLDVIFEELVSEDFKKMEAFLREPKNNEDFRIQLDLFLSNYIDFSLKHLEVISLYLEEIERGNSQALDIFPSTYGKIWLALNRFLDAARKNNLLNKDLDSKILAYQIISPVNHLLRSRKTSLRAADFSLSEEPFRKKFISQMVALVS